MRSLKCKLLLLALFLSLSLLCSLSFTRACNHWLIRLQGPLQSFMPANISHERVKNWNEKIKYHTYQSVVKTHTLFLISHYVDRCWRKMLACSNTKAMSHNANCSTVQSVSPNTIFNCMWCMQQRKRRRNWITLSFVLLVRMHFAPQYCNCRLYAIKILHIFQHSIANFHV